MDDIFSRIAAAADLTPAAAKTAVGYILAYMQAESEDDSIDSMIAATPGAADAMATDFDGSGGIMALGSRLMALGLDMGQIREVAETLVATARDHAGEEVVDRAIASVPALAQFI